MDLTDKREAGRTVVVIAVNNGKARVDLERRKPPCRSGACTGTPPGGRSFAPASYIQQVKAAHRAVQHLEDFMARY